MATQFPRMGQMKMDVADHLTRANCRSIMTLLNWPPGKQDRVNCVEDLLNEMESTRFISEDNFQSLVDTLETLSLIEAAYVVRKYMPESAHLSFPSQMPPTLPNRGVFQPQASAMYHAPIMTYQQPLKPEKPTVHQQLLGSICAPQTTPQMPLQQHYSMTNTRKRLEQLQLHSNAAVGPQMAQAVYAHQFASAWPMHPTTEPQKQQHVEEGVTVSDIDTWRSFKEKFYHTPFPDDTARNYQFVPNELNFVLIGKTGSGKSATGNTLAGREYFKEGDGTTSQTKTISLCNFCEGDRHCSVIDTPGLFDTETHFTNDAMVLEIVKTMTKFCRGIHLFLLVCKADMKFTDEERETVLSIERILSKHVYQHCVIVLTRARAKFGGKKKTRSLTNFIAAEKERNGDFAQLIAKVSDRVVAVENDFEDGIAVLHRQTLLRYLMAVIDRKKGTVFSDKLFSVVEEKIKRDEIERQKRIQKDAQLSQMEYTVQKFLYDQFLETLSVENLNQISAVLKHCVDHIRMHANVSNLNYVGRNDVVKFLRKFAIENKRYIQSLSELKSQERALQNKKKERDEINAAKVGEKLPSLLNLEPENKLEEFKVCLDQKDLSRVKVLLSNFAYLLSEFTDFDTTGMGNIEELLQMYCLTNAEIVKGNIEAILKRRLKVKQIEEEKIQQEKRNEVLAKISEIIDKDLDSYLTNKTTEELNGIVNQLKNDQIPSEIFHGVKSRLSEDEVAQLDDKSIETEIVRQLRAKKTRIDELVKKAGKCFAGSVVVQTKSNGPKSISDVKVNDEILVFDDDGHLFYEKVYLISHANATEEVRYVRIATKQGKVLFISPDHILPIGSLCKHIPAKNTVVGDAIFTINYGVLTPDVVTSVSYQICAGAFCPMTLSGKIVVNDVAASCYTTFVNPTLAHILLSPFRIMFMYLPTSVFNKTLPYDSVEGMPLILAASRAAVNFMRSTLRYLKLL